jgi:hypothetical protein
LSARVSDSCLSAPQGAQRPDCLNLSNHRWLQGSGLVLLTLAVLFARRPDQFLHPAIWVEDGVLTLKEFVARGALIIAEPFGFYLAIASKLISYVAYRTSILRAPEIETALISALTCAVILAVAFSPTHLRWPGLCAAAVLLVPSDPEVFAVGAYAFWWAGILLLLALLWDSARGYEPVRWSFILFGGLSAPIVVPIAGLLWLRLAIERRWSDLVAASLASLIAAIQLAVVHRTAVDVHTGALAATVPALVTKFVLWYFPHRTAHLIAVTAVLLLLVFLARDALDRWFGMLVLALVAVATSVVARLGSSAIDIDPFVAGPRYFFYPFVLTSWMLIWIAACSSFAARGLALAAIAGAIIVASPGMSRRHDEINWRAHVEACADAAGTYELPIHYSGRRAEMWHAQMTGADCRALIAQSLL